jgi:hypothetical protein
VAGVRVRNGCERENLASHRQFVRLARMCESIRLSRIARMVFANSPRAALYSDRSNNEQTHSDLTTPQPAAHEKI